MKIYDLTSLLNNDEHNYYCFNGALIQHVDNTYILTYRIAKYNLPIKCHPWNIWDNGYKKFNNPEVVLKNKYRNYYGSPHQIPFTRSNTNQIPTIDEYDSTGLAILKFSDDKFQIVHNFNNIFLNELNQDTRITKICHGKYRLSYNVYENLGSCKYLKMRTRELAVEEDKLYLSEEIEMFRNKKIIEKNCVYDNKCNILYELYPEFIVMTHKDMVQTEFTQAKKLVGYYGESNIFISVSTPPIKFGNNYLAVSHIKVKYKVIKDTYPFKIFYDSIDFNKIQKHGKFIYFMMLFAYDENYNIVKVSNPFIPQLNMCHLPWLLSFAMSICRIGSGYAISYGEGDCRCKILLLSEEEINTLLRDEFDLGFYFLTNQNKLVHYGYFHELNCGDDMFMKIFQYLHKKYYPYYCVNYSNNCDEKSDLFVIGGGMLLHPILWNH